VYANEWLRFNNIQLGNGSTNYHRVYHSVHNIESFLYQPSNKTLKHWCLQSTSLQAWHICPAGFRCGWPVDVELAARLPEGSSSRQEALRDGFICTVQMHAAH